MKQYNEYITLKLNHRISDKREVVTKLQNAGIDFISFGREFFFSTEEDRNLTTLLTSEFWSR